jgi:hypothetical protein
MLTYADVCRRASAQGILLLESGAREHTSAYVSIRQQTSADVSIRQHMSAYASRRQHTLLQHTLAYVGIRAFYSCRETLARERGGTMEPPNLVPKLPQIIEFST